jgi:hypothetical protein
MPIRVLTILLSCLVSFASVNWPANRSEDSKTIGTLAPGVEHVLLKRGDFNELVRGDRWTIHLRDES